MVGNRFATTQLGNLTSFYNFIMFLTYFLKILFRKEVVWFFSKQHGREKYNSIVGLSFTNIWTYSGKAYVVQKIPQMKIS